MKGKMDDPPMEEEPVFSQTEQSSQSQSHEQEQEQDIENTAKKTNGKVKFPCLICGKSCARGAIQCNICALWCHNACTKLSKEALKGLEVQHKEVGQAYWACTPCRSFNNKWNAQMRDVNKRQEETEKKVDENTKNIDDVRKMAEATRRELREHARQTENMKETLEMAMDEELREREARRLNLVIHGVQEVDPGIKNTRDRMDRDMEQCESIFITMRARTRIQQLRFCRRIGERGQDPRPVVIGVYTEEEKRHILEKSRELRYSKYENVTVVPDLTKNQRKGEQKMRDEASRRNENLTQEDIDKNLKWIVVGRRGEKRIIKGTEREAQGGRDERRLNWTEPAIVRGGLTNRTGPENRTGPVQQPEWPTITPAVEQNRGPTRSVQDRTNQQDTNTRRDGYGGGGAGYGGGGTGSGSWTRGGGQWGGQRGRGGYNNYAYNGPRGQFGNGYRGRREGQEDRPWDETGARRKDIQPENIRNGEQDRPERNYTNQQEVEWGTGELPDPIGFKRDRINSKRTRSGSEDEGEQDSRRLRH